MRCYGATYNINYSYKYISALKQIEHIAFTKCHLHHELIEPTIYPISMNQSMIPQPCRA
jgi:HD-GYP domain-containing protein (c-di-GMP phosphodiesterase class II)